MLIQPISWFSQELLWRVEEILTNMFDGAFFYVSSDIILPPLTAFNWYRRQYYSPSILRYIFGKVKEILTYGQNHAICLGDIDAYSNGLNFVFGEAFPDLNIACVYTRRLKPYHHSRHITDSYYKLYILRIVKEVVHEWGHLLGLPHCTNRKCVMSFSNSVIDVDTKTPFFCNKCKEKLLRYHNIVQRDIAMID